jgi:hypothetical protein
MTPSKQVLVLLRFYDFRIGLETTQMANRVKRAPRRRRGLTPS